MAFCVCESAWEIKRVDKGAKLALATYDVEQVMPLRISAIDDLRRGPGGIVWGRHREWILQSCNGGTDQQ